MTTDTRDPDSTADEIDTDDLPEMERHVVREPRAVEGGYQAGFAVVEVGDEVIAFENFLFDEDDEAVLTQDPIAVEKGDALLAMIPLNEIYERDYRNDDD